MGIAEEIQQSKFKDSYQKAAINIIYTSNWLGEKVREHLADADLTNQQYNVLRILRGSHPAPLSTLQIRERMLDKMSDTSRIVDRLLKKGLAQKNTCKSDKRLVDVTISQAGLGVLGQLDVHEDRMFLGLHNLSPQEAETLSKFLDKIRQERPSDQ